MSREEILEELRSIDYDLLNEYLFKSIYNSQNDIRKSVLYFDDIIKFTNVILTDLSYHSFDEKAKYSMHNSFQETLNITGDFFQSFKNDYSSRFWNILDDGSVSIQMSGDGSEKENRISLDGKMQLTFDGSIKDIFATGHEITHKFSATYNQMSYLRFFLAESTSITSEFLMYQFLHEQNTFFEKDLLTYILSRFASFKKSAILLKEEYKLYKLYLEKGFIDEDILFEYLSDCNSIKRTKTVIKRIMERKALAYFRSLKYIIGSLIACGFYSRMIDGESIISDFEQLVHLLGGPHWESKKSMDILRGLDIPVLKDNVDLSRVEDDYHKVFKLFKDKWDSQKY